MWQDIAPTRLCVTHPNNITSSTPPSGMDGLRQKREDQNTVFLSVLLLQNKEQYQIKIGGKVMNALPHFIAARLSIGSSTTCTIVGLS